MLGEKVENFSFAPFWSSLGEKGEKIQHFACNSAFENIRQSGNFVSDRRIASYWIEKGQKEIVRDNVKNKVTIDVQKSHLPVYQMMAYPAVMAPLPMVSEVCMKPEKY